MEKSKFYEYLDFPREDYENTHIEVNTVSGKTYTVDSGCNIHREGDAISFTTMYHGLTSTVCLRFDAIESVLYYDWD